MRWPSPPRHVLLSCVAFALTLALCCSQNAPSPSPETPVSRYLQVMSESARALQKGQPLYDFKARPVTGNGMHTILMSKGSATSCVEPSADSALCSAVQGLVVMPVVCAAVGITSFIVWFSFVCARKYCKCCCNNCGSRKPQPEGGKYTQRSKIIIAVIIFFSCCVIIAITSMAISAAYDAPATLARFYSSILDFLDQSTSFLNSANTFVLSNGPTIGGAIESVQTSFSTLQNTLNSSQINANSQLLSMGTSLTILAAGCSNFTTSAACSGAVDSFRSKIQSSISSLNRFQVKSLALSNVAGDIPPKLAKNTQPTRDAIADGSKFAASSRKSLLTFQLETSNPQGQAQLGTLLLFGSMWLIPLFCALAFMCHKWTHWYLPLWISFLGSLVFWLLLGGLYVISYILNNTCDLMPTDQSARAAQPLAVATGSALLQSFFDQCVTQGGSRSLFAVVNVSTAELDKQVADFSLSKQINISYISEYNQTLLNEVKDNQATFDNLNAASFIGSTGVSEGTAALSSISTGGIHATACGSRIYTTSNAFECLRICQATAIVACRRSAAYGFASVHSQLLSLTNPMVLTNITAMNTTVNAIVPAIGVADAQLKMALNTLASGFLRFNQCGWIGKSFVSIRTNLCGSVADTINVMWLCCGVLAFVLMYLPIVFIKAEKRFKRTNLEKEKMAHDKKYEPLRHARRQSLSQPPLNSSSFPGDGAPASASAPPISSIDYVSLDIPQYMMPSPAAPALEDAPAAAPASSLDSQTPVVQSSVLRGPLRNPYAQA